MKRDWKNELESFRNKKSLSEQFNKEIVLVTGGSGLVGQAIKKIVSQQPEYGQYQFCFASSKTADLTDRLSTQRLFENVKPAFVIHLAARVGGLYRNLNEPLKMYKDNMAINSNVVWCCQKYPIIHSIHCLSTCVFPDNIQYPISEGDLHNGPPHSSNEAYAYAKRMLELQTRLHNQQNYKVDEKGRKIGAMTCVIPTNVYGPHDNFHLEDSHVIPGLIHKAFIAARDNKDFVVKGTGKPLRQFIHAEDLAQLILWNLFNYSGRGTSMIMAPNPESEVSIGDVAKIIAAAFEIDEDRIKFQSTYSDGQFRKTAKNVHLTKMLLDYPEFSFMPIEKGIQSTVQWFKENYDQARK